MSIKAINLSQSILIQNIYRSRNLPVGETVKFNGTDLYTIDCQGLMIEVDSAQDYITDYHNLRIPLGEV